ncbi:hypothetical protein CAI21_08785 [Alkalilimnicola ehrlichii]|uniref:Uncharacterized protein n=1 Tax=Alkalilimnicola ehrlichii TaxID=351052 RepID=A0A3E0WU50_9GAMM|nr:hypothetical protein [Alkalilimnicola ehrlichii]RFA29912.1 hypothetical protein CAI21_08785 [Alkalilimnicola ehrlichii]RFA36500.1 hypothetical protein CAL65_11060 [Alkalilimnicola ehrlichii]
MNPFVTALLQDLVFFGALIGLSAFIAKKRGRNVYLWGALSILIIPILVLLFLPKKSYTVPSR